jgi:hypothetical protein
MPHGGAQELRHFPSGTQKMLPLSGLKADGDWHVGC